MVVQSTSLNMIIVNECFDHNKTMLNNNRENISFEILGNYVLDTICFLTEQGFKYYFPAMVRLALLGEGEKCYLNQFLFHLSTNPNCMSFTKDESDFVCTVLEYILYNRIAAIEEQKDTDLLLKTIEIWQVYKNTGA